MKKLCYLLGFWALPCLLMAQNAAQPPVQHLWGIVTRDSLIKEPHASWFKKGYDDYQPTPSVIEVLKRLKTNDLSVKIFFGTWCGDTKRELPRLQKVLDAMDFPKDKISYIAVSSKDSIYKQSKNREERGYNIFRVGCYVIERKDVEVNRITEFPVLSMERDLLAILSGQNYTPQYAGYLVVEKWLKDGWLTDDNITPQSLASHLKGKVNSMSELNAAGYVLMAAGQKAEAVKIFRINANLFPEEASAWHSLAEGWLKLGNKERATTALEYGLQINKNPDLAKEFLSLQKQILK
jgi:tetratricopeptide (TPR) repeat protein